MTVPYYGDSRVTLWHGDCREVLPTLKRQSVDLVLTDPPFFMPAVHYQSRTQWQRSWSDTSILAAFWSAVLDGVLPLMRPTAHLLAFCNSDSYPVFYPDTYRRFDVLRSLVWDKLSIGMGQVWRHQHELVLAARWSESFASPSHRGQSDVLRAPATPSVDRGHPVEKPIGLLSQLIDPVTPAAGVVLDPFAGSGSTLIAARDSGRRAIGVEAEERYCEVIARRLAQDSLFAEVAE